jgi:hypothetical protein
LINGVNFNLKGDGTSDQDFFLSAPDRDCFPNGGCQTVNDTPSVPEPAGVVYFLAGMAGMFVVGRRISMYRTS